MGIRRHSLALLALGFVLLTAGLPCRAQENLPGLKQLFDKGKLVVAVINREQSPFFFTGDDGELAGFDIDLARAIGDRLDIKIEFDRSAETYDEVVELVAAGQADVAISFLSRTPARARVVLFTRPYVTQDVTLLINRLATVGFAEDCPSLAEVLTAAEFSGALGVEAETALAARLRELNPNVQPREFQSPEDLIDAVRAGQIAVSLQGELVARSYLHDNPASHIRLRLCEAPESRPDRIAIAVPPGQYDLLQWLNIFLENQEILYDAADLVGQEGSWRF